MPNPTSELPEASETQQAIRSLAIEIREAVAQADADRVRRLTFTRHQLLRKACGPDGAVRFSDSQRTELIRENDEWGEALLEHQKRIKAEIERLRARRNTRRILNNTYRSAPSTISRCFAHQG